MGKNQKLITKLRNIYKKQDEAFIEIHKLVLHQIKSFSYNDLKLIIANEELELAFLEVELQEKRSKNGKS